MTLRCSKARLLTRLAQTVRLGLFGETCILRDLLSESSMNLEAYRRDSWPSTPDQTLLFSPHQNPANLLFLLSFIDFDTGLEPERLVKSSTFYAYNSSTRSLLQLSCRPA